MAATTNTNLDILTDAYRKLNVIDQSQSPSSEQGVVGLSVLNDLLADFIADGVRLSWYTQTNLAATAPLEDSDVRAVKLCLAGSLATEYGLPLTPELASEIDTAYTKLQKRYLRYVESASELPREQSSVDGSGMNT